MSTPINPSRRWNRSRRANARRAKSMKRLRKWPNWPDPTSRRPTSFRNLIAALTGIQAPAGAISMRTPQGFLQLQCQYNLDNVGLDRHKGGRQSHNELLRQAFTMNKQMLLGPFDTTGVHEGPPAGNPTEFVNLIAPIQLEKMSPAWSRYGIRLISMRECNGPA